MATVETRIERIERTLGATDCTCGDCDSTCIVVCPDNWNDDQKRAEAASMGTTCPTHGPRLRRVLWISETDRKL
jgi:hypothetical protein